MEGMWIDRMLNITSDASRYIKFLSLADAVKFPVLDPIEERLLHYITLGWYSDKRMTVLETMKATPDISPSTVHRRIKTLRKKGLVGLDVDPIDNRIKYIVHTDLTNRYFTQLGQCLSKAVET